jgi:protein-ribulosamine 3-kinase
MKQHIRSLLDTIAKGLSEIMGESISLEWVRNLPGGDINYAAHIRCENRNWFLKYHTNAPKGMFAGEANALTEIVDQDRIKAPRPIIHGNHGNIDWLVLEFIELSSSGSAAQFGEELAALHTVTREQFGWSQNNYIGTTPQINTYCDDWGHFWRDYRLKPQLELVHKAGHEGRVLSLGEQLLEHVDQLMDGHQPAASLLHGDLWAGNKAFTTDGKPVIFDPASYYGDREADIAMTQLFGGFGKEFYSAYQAHSPLPDGYQLRRDLYNLYHMLNHLNLFGRGYLSRCENMIVGLLAQVK